MTKAFRSMRGLSLVAGAAAGIAFLTTSCWRTHLRDCSVQCGERSACPSGMKCSGGLCTGGATCGASDTTFDAMDATMEVPAEGSTCPAAFDAADPSDASADGDDQITIANVWASPIISVCWDGSGFDDEKRWIRDASLDSWEAVSAVRFTGWLPCAAAGADIRMRVAPTCGAPTPTGTEVKTSPGGLVFDLGIPGCTREHQACVRAEAVHVLGHALGFEHRDNPAHLPSGCAAGGGGDVDSVMSYCSSKPFLGNALLGAVDIVDVLNAYGAGPSPFIFQNAATALRQVSTISEAGGYLFRALYNVIDGSATADQVVAGRNGSLLLYTKAGGGHIDVGTLTGEANIVLTGSVNSIGANWSAITAVQNGYYLFFDAAREGGYTSIRRADATGRDLGETGHAGGLGTAWTDVIGLVNGEVFFYDGIAGRGQPAHVSSDGQLELQGEMIAGLPLYTLIAAVNVRGLLLYIDDLSKTVGGRADFAVLREDGAFQLVGPRTELPAHIERLVGARNGSLLMYGDQSDPLGAIRADVGVVTTTGTLGALTGITGFMLFDKMSAD